MPIYTGTTADGSDMKEFEGFPTSPCGKYFSSKEMTDKEWAELAFEMEKKETRKERRIRERKDI